MKKEKKEVEMKICRFCGSAYKANKKYCPKCYKDESGESHAYVPMDEKKIKRVRIILGVIFIVIFIVVFVLVKLK